MNGTEFRSKTADGAGTRSGSKVLAERIYDTLRQDILCLVEPPRRRLDEAELAARFQVSRTPIREALRRLSLEGLVDIRPHHGASVAALDLVDAVEYFEVVLIIQKAILALAALRRADEDLAAAIAAQDDLERAAAQREVARIPLLNRQFHLRLAAGSHNARLIRQYSRLLDDGMRMAHLPLQNYVRQDWVRDMNTLNNDHRALLAAVEARDTAEVARISDRHVALFQNQVFFALSNHESDVEAVATLASDHLLKQENTDV